MVSQDKFYCIFCIKSQKDVFFLKNIFDVFIVKQSLVFFFIKMALIICSKKKTTKRNVLHFYSRPLVKSVYLRTNFLISHPKHVFWVLKRTVSFETVLLSTQNTC